MSNEEFDALREDLSWEGSALVRLNRDETKFLNAMSAYAKGKPILSDDEFDQLKQRLRDSSSPIAAGNEPKCFLDTGLCKATWKTDSIRTSSLYLPATLFFTTLSIGVVSDLFCYIR